MEELLNKLIEKGRVPFGDKRITNVSWKMQYVGTYNWLFWSNHNVVEMRKSTRELVSKSSGLWQFVCENGMVDKKKIGIFYEMFLEGNGIDAKNYRPFSLGERLIIESALCDEDKLEQFLLDNIKI